jgi:hypothetical protein
MRTISPRPHVPDQIPPRRRDAFRTVAVCDDTNPRLPWRGGVWRICERWAGGDVYIVTNLNNAGAGSFADAIATVPAAGRTIVFAVSGHMHLPTGKELRLTKAKVTIAGQTAPGAGIGIKDGTFRISGDDVAVRHVRFRFRGHAAGGDCVSLDSRSLNTVFDSSSMQFSTHRTHQFVQSAAGERDDGANQTQRHLKGGRLLVAGAGVFRQRATFANVRFEFDAAVFRLGVGVRLCPHVDVVAFAGGERGFRNERVSLLFKLQPRLRAGRFVGGDDDIRPRRRDIQRIGKHQQACEHWILRKQQHEPERAARSRDGNLPAHGAERALFGRLGKCHLDLCLALHRDVRVGSTQPTARPVGFSGEMMCSSNVVLRVTYKGRSDLLSLALCPELLSLVCRGGKPRIPPRPLAAGPEPYGRALSTTPPSPPI